MASLRCTWSTLKAFCCARFWSPWPMRAAAPRDWHERNWWSTCGLTCRKESNSSGEFCWLVVTGTWLLFSHILEIIIPVTNLFQRGWNHQPVWFWGNPRSFEETLVRWWSFQDCVWWQESPNQTGETIEHMDLHPSKLWLPGIAAPPIWMIFFHYKPFTCGYHHVWKVG